MNNVYRWSALLKTLLCMAGIACLQQVAHSQVWQWATPVEGARKAGSTAYLWVPENVKKVKAIVIAQHNMEEISILENPLFRGDMQKLSFAIIWVSPSFDHFFRFDEGAGAVLDSFLNQLAVQSGYSELSYVPLVPVGHSAAASWPYYYAAWNPARTLCAISVSGQWPWFRDTRFAPDIWGQRTIDYIPCLETMGEYEAAANFSKEGVKQRKEHPLMPLSMLSCPGEGHFAASDKKIKYIALYIKKAAQYRLPAGYTAAEPAVLKPVNPLTGGWLKERWLGTTASPTTAGPVKEYRGDTTQAFWFFDKEMVQATLRYEQYAWERKPQLLGILQNGKAVKQRNSHLQVHVPFEPLDDGITFHLKACFLDTVPGESNRPKNHTGLPVGSSIGHAADAKLLNIERVCGPFIKLNDTTFRLSLQRGEAPGQKQYSLVFAVTHPGDAAYKPYVQQAEMTVPVKNTKGAEQHIQFPAIDDKKAGCGVIPLRAVSDRHLPVGYYIKEGPAYVKDGLLYLTPVPRTVRWPVKITVVAWQYGKSSTPAVQTAPEVEQTFYLTP